MNRRSFLAAVGLSPIAAVPFAPEPPIARPRGPNIAEVRQWALQIEVAIAESAHRTSVEEIARDAAQRAAGQFVSFRATPGEIVAG
jgi:hypothetical protein